MTKADQILPFLFNLQFPVALPQGFGLLNPFAEIETRQACTSFYHKFYNDQLPRYCIIGINPGRFGGGITGVPFTDPVRLQTAAGIPNNWPKKQELSSLFIYDVIDAFGGIRAFYESFYITSVSPLGLVKDGKNINYYDDKTLLQTIEPFAVDCLRQQLSWGMHRSVAFCLGEGKNYAYLSRLNQKHQLFDKVVPLSHPRFVMQYKLKTKADYIQQYLRAFADL